MKKKHLRSKKIPVNLNSQSIKYLIESPKSGRVVQW